MGETLTDTIEIASSQVEAAEVLGPRMARYGFAIICLLAFAALLANLFLPSPHRKVSLLFYSIELAAYLALFWVSYTAWFRARWEQVLLVTAVLLLIGIAAASVASRDFAPATFGLLLMQMGFAAYVPWRSSYQFWFNVATIGCIGIFTAFVGLDRLLVSYWIVLITGSVIGQVACVSSNRYRAELDRRLESVAAEVRKREAVIAQLRETQRELVVSREAALAASRVRTEFLSSMSHEIRTPMNSVLGMAELLSDTDLNPEQRRCLDLIQANGETLLELINSILDLARLESGRLNLDAAEFDLREMLEQLLDTLAVSAFGKQLELVGRVSVDVPQKVVGDAFRLRQILTNLIGNAIKFTEQGQVVVRIEPELPGKIRFSVADTGIGISGDKLKMIFEPFTQADSSSVRSYRGSGLGLAIVERLVGLMGGELRADSEPGQGSTFIVTVPIEPAPSFDKAIEPFDALAGARALVVDDNAEVRGAVQDMLARLRVDTDQCASVPDAIRLLEEARRTGLRYAMVLLDGSPPGSAVPGVIESFAAAAIEPSRIIMMLRSTDLTRELAGLRAAGLDAYVTKPIKAGDLAAACLAVVAPEGTLPQRERGKFDAAEEAENMPPARLLMADDVAVNRTLVRGMLTGMPFQIDDAVDGQDAVSKVIAESYDLVLMDMQMPVLDGYDAAAAIRKWERENQHLRVPIIALTASALEADIKRAVEAGCDAHLAKPFRRKDLVKLLREQLAKAHPGAPSKTAI
jgi:signal transduction histidine kinase/CheY-like chemotaxis protein